TARGSRRIELFQLRPRALVFDEALRTALRGRLPCRLGVSLVATQELPLTDVELRLAPLPRRARGRNGGLGGAPADKQLDHRGGPPVAPGRYPSREPGIAVYRACAGRRQMAPQQRVHVARLRGENTGEIVRGRRKLAGVEVEVAPAAIGVRIGGCPADRL